MWQNAEIVGLLDRQGRIRFISRNEEEALIHNVVGQLIGDLLTPASLDPFEAAFQAALLGNETQVLLAGVADEGFVFWGRAHLGASPEPTAPVLFHLRRLPRPWSLLSEREKETIDALNASRMNAKQAARKLGISAHTLNSHRRSICRKCGLHGVGEFWVFVERCR